MEHYQVVHFRDHCSEFLHLSMSKSLCVSEGSQLLKLSSGETAFRVLQCVGIGHIFSMLTKMSLLDEGQELFNATKTNSEKIVTLVK